MTSEWAVLIHDIAVVLAWIAGVVFCLSGLQDLIYDVGAIVLRMYRRIVWRRDNPRLTIQRLRDREEQPLAVIVPAWNEGELVGDMLRNVLKKAEYSNYVVFVGVYPNDPKTGEVVDAVHAEDSRVVKVVTDREGPTTKADCLNNVIRALKQYEAQQQVTFEIIVMHDAEDVVHPHSFLLFNYLIPRVDAIQVPVLPLPTDWHRWVHWVYADEFAENHMKDVPVREKLSGFVPFAGTGTGFSRRAFFMLEETTSKVFNESSMTEDYSLSRRMHEMGLKEIFVNVVLANDRSRWWVPLHRRPEFIANWAFFPMDFTRSLRQKTRWIIGISLQEWRNDGWRGTFAVKENLVKDRKVFLSALTTLLAYLIFIYFVVFEFTQAGWLKIDLEPVIYIGTPLYWLACACTVFMAIRMVGRAAYVTMVYGIWQGLFSIPRILLANVVNGLAAFRAFKIFLGAVDREGKVAWDNTEHVEGVGQLPVDIPKRSRNKPKLGTMEALGLLKSRTEAELVKALGSIPRNLWHSDRKRAIRVAKQLVGSRSTSVRASVARAMGYLGWDELSDELVMLLRDKDWVVRSNAARAILKMPNLAQMIDLVFEDCDPFGCEVLIRTIEQSTTFQKAVIPALAEITNEEARQALMNSSVLKRRIKVI